MKIGHLKLVGTLGLLAIASIVHADPGIVRLTPTEAHGGETNKTMLPTGLEIQNTTFYYSEASSVSVGRSHMSGGLLPMQKIEYTDVVYIARGSGVAHDKNGRVHESHAGSIVLLPRGMEFESKISKDWIHFYAAFETQLGAKSNGPTEPRQLDPSTLADSDYEEVGGELQHVYYRGTGGVEVKAVKTNTADKSARPQKANHSELMFIVAGTGSIEGRGAEPEQLKMGDVLLLKKGVEYKLSGSGLSRVAVQFEADASSAGAASNGR